MRWEVVGLVLGWTIGLVAVPLAVVILYSAYSEGLEPAIRTFAIPLLVSLLSGFLMVSIFGRPTSIELDYFQLEIEK